MQFNEGSDVYTADGEKLGSVERVVLDPLTEEVTHLVVRKGFLLPTDKVISVDLVTTTTEDQVALRATADELPSLPDFEETHYVSFTEEGTHPQERGPFAYPVYWYPPVGAAWWGYPISPYVGMPPAKVVRNIPEGTVALAEGARVISADGEHVGDVERVFVDSETDHVTHFVISQGLLLKERKLVPTLWVDTIGEEQVRLGVKSAFINSLPEYEPMS